MIVDRVIRWARQKSPWIIHFNSGACNACDIEIIASLTPHYDVERLGLQLKGSPRHADVLVCSGPVTMQQRDRLITIYEQMAEPKFVIAVGTCSCSAGVFQGCYCVEGGVDAAIPVDLYIPGCPVKPEAIIDGVAKLINSLNDNKKPRKKAKKAQEPEAAPAQEEVNKEQAAQAEPAPAQPEQVAGEPQKE